MEAITPIHAFYHIHVHETPTKRAYDLPAIPADRLQKNINRLRGSGLDIEVRAGGTMQPAAKGTATVLPFPALPGPKPNAVKVVARQEPKPTTPARKNEAQIRRELEKQERAAIRKALTLERQAARKQARQAQKALQKQEQEVKRKAWYQQRYAQAKADRQARGLKPRHKVVAPKKPIIDQNSGIIYPSTFAARAALKVGRDALYRQLKGEPIPADMQRPFQLRYAEPHEISKQLTIPF